MAIRAGLDTATKQPRVAGAGRIAMRPCVCLGALVGALAITLTGAARAQDHGAMPGMAMPGMAMPMPPSAGTPAAAFPATTPAVAPAGTGIPAAPPEASAGHAHSPIYFGAVLLDQNELRSTGRGGPFYAFEGSGYYGTDVQRLWVNGRFETSSERGGLERAEVQVLYSRLLSYFWDVQGGIRQDFQVNSRQGTPARTYAQFGFQGLAPGYFQVQAHAFVSQEGVVLARTAGSYDLLITNRLILQPEIELNFATGRDNGALISGGLYRVETGLRLRYEISREFAPYIGYSYESYTNGSAGLTRRTGQQPGQSTVVAGIRLFF